MKTTKTIKRGEVWWINFEKTQGGEIKKKRPGIIISNNLANKHLNRIQIVAMTKNASRLYPGEAIVTLKNKKGKAMANQLHTVTKERIIEKIGKLNQTDIISVEQAIRTQLEL